MIATHELDHFDVLIPDTPVAYADLPNASEIFSTTKDNIFTNPVMKLLKDTPGVLRITDAILESLTVGIFGRYSFPHIKVSGLKKTGFLRISYGCLGRCSYCALPAAPGKHQSKPFDTCIREFAAYLEKGYRNIFITADDTGAYGKDIGSSFAKLLEQLTRFEGTYRLHISSLNPEWMHTEKDVWTGMFTRGKIVSVVIPVQSGSRNILKLMRRNTEIEKTQEMITSLKKAFPKLWTGTHIIAGFPSETNEEFQQTPDFVSQTPINEAQLFGYGRKSGTPTDAIKEQVPDETIYRRTAYAADWFTSHTWRASNMCRSWYLHHGKTYNIRQFSHPD